MIEFTVERLALTLAIVAALAFFSGSWLTAELWLRERAERIDAQAALTAAIDQLVADEEELEASAIELHRADRVCSIWRETSSWYQRAYLQSTGAKRKCLAGVAANKPSPSSKPHQ